MKKNRCRCCLKRDFLLYLDLGKQPLANSFHNKKKKLPTYPLSVMLCKSCFHSQLSITVNPNLMFSNYLYISGTSKVFHEHFRKMTNEVVALFADHKPNVLDIGCNDGIELEYFRKLGCYVAGVDPAKNLAKITKKKNIPVFVDYWNLKLANKLKGKFDVITASNVFAHTNDLDGFLNASRIALKKNGFLIIEFPYIKNLIKNFEFDTIYHEHLSYFTVNSMSVLTKRLGFGIVDIKNIPIHGGSLRFFLKKDADHAPVVGKMINVEKKLNLLNISGYKDFAEKIKQNKIDFKQQLSKLSKQGYKIVGYAAAAKSSTSLNYFKANIDYIVDDNSLKQWLFSPGRDIPIVPSSTMASDNKKLAIIIFSWTLASEIANKIISIRGKKTKDVVLLYVPRVQTLTLKKALKFGLSA